MENEIQKMPEPRPNNLMRLSKEIIQRIEKTDEFGYDFYLSAYYFEDPVNEKDMKYELARLLRAFPEIKSSVVEELIQQIRKEKIGPIRLQAAVDYVIKNFNWQKPTVSDVIKFDRKLRLHTYEEVCKKVVTDGMNMNSFFIVPNSDKLWAVKTDAMKLGLTFLINKK